VTDLYRRIGQKGEKPPQGNLFDQKKEKRLHVRPGGKGRTDQGGKKEMKTKTAGGEKATDSISKRKKVS